MDRGHIHRVDNLRQTKKPLEWVLRAIRPREKPGKQWKRVVEEDLTRLEGKDRET